MRNIAAFAAFTFTALSAPWPTIEAQRTTSAAQPARLVRAEVRVGNKVVLRGAVSDDGTPDADEVWSMAHKVKMLPTEDFSDLNVPADADTFMVMGTPIPPHPIVDNELFERDAVFEIRGGGKIETMALKIERADGLFSKPSWRIPREVLTSRFNSRLIQRYQARKLKKPGRTR